MIDPKLIAQLAAKSAAETSLKTILADSTSPSARAAFGIQPKVEVSALAPSLPIIDPISSNNRVAEALSKIQSATSTHNNSLADKSNAVYNNHIAGDNIGLSTASSVVPGNINSALKTVAIPQDAATSAIYSDWFKDEPNIGLKLALNEIGQPQNTIQSAVADRINAIFGTETRDSEDSAIYADWYRDEPHVLDLINTIEREENPMLKLLNEPDKDSELSIRQLSNKDDTKENGRFEVGHIIAGSKSIELGKGWYMRSERGVGPNQQKHTHVFNGSQKWAQNEDGSPHDDGGNSSGSPPKSVLKELKKRGWDWEQKEKDWLNKIEIYSGEDLTIVYPNGRKVTIVYDYNPISMPYWPSNEKLKEYYFGPTRIDLRSGSGNTSPEIPSYIVPMPNPVPLPIPAPAPMPLPIPIF